MTFTKYSLILPFVHPIFSISLFDRRLEYLELFDLLSLKERRDKFIKTTHFKKDVSSLNLFSY